MAIWRTDAVEGERVKEAKALARDALAMESWSRPFCSPARKVADMGSTQE